MPTEPTSAPNRIAAAERTRDWVLVLSGGNALAAYQAGAHETLHRAGMEPGWVAGTSAGAINAALIVGNPPEDRVEKLRAFWATAAAPHPLAWAPSRGNLRRLYNAFGAARTWLFGRPPLFIRRFPEMPSALPGAAEEIGFFDLAPLRSTLEALVDFDRINDGAIRLTVNATDIGTGDHVVFDNTRDRIGPEHILASSALPPDFRPVAVAGRYFCDGAMTANALLEAVLAAPRDRDTLCILVDLFDRRAPPPKSLDDVLQRRLDLVFSGQVAQAIATCRDRAHLRQAVRKLADELPPTRLADPEIGGLAAEGSDAAVTLLHVIYQSRGHELAAKMYDYAEATLRERWAAGREDMADALAMLDDAAPRRAGLTVHEFRWGRVEAEV